MLNIYDYAHALPRIGEGRVPDGLKDLNGMSVKLTALLSSRIRAAALAFVVLLVVPMAFVEPAFADPTLDDASEEVQPVSSAEQQRYEAILYSDGELVIRKADPATPAGQSESAVEPANEVLGGGPEGPSQTSGADSGAGNEKQPANDRAKGGVVAGQADAPASQPDAAARTESVAPANASASGAGPDPFYRGLCLWPMWWQDPVTPARRYVVATYDDVGAEVDRVDNVKWYGNRDKIKSVVFGEGVTPESMAYWFSGLQNLSDINFAGLDTSHATNMQSLFDGCQSLKAIDVRGFDTSRVTNMSRLFAGCSSLVDIDLSSFNTSLVTSMDGMFAGCSSVRALNLSGFDTSNVKSTKGMLEGCSSLAALDASGFSSSQLSAMAVPANKGGYWRFNVPEDYPIDVGLRAPTAEERAAFGLPAGLGGGGNSGSGFGGGATWEPVAGDDEGLPAVDEGEQAPGTPVADQGDSKTSDSGAGSNSVVGADVDADASEAPAADTSAAAGIFGASAIADANKAEAADEDSLLQLVGAVSVIAQTAGSPAIARGVADALLGDAMHHAAEVAMVLAAVTPGISAVAERLANPWPSTPMAPFGIPLNLLATALLLLVAVPATFLILRDRRL